MEKMKISRIVLSVIVMLLCVGSYAQEYIDSNTYQEVIEDSITYYQRVDVQTFEDGRESISKGRLIDSAQYDRELENELEFHSEEIRNTHQAFDNLARLKKLYREADDRLEDLTGQNYLKRRTAEYQPVVERSKWILRYPDKTEVEFSQTGNNTRVKAENGDYFKVNYYGPGYLKLSTGIFASKNRDFFEYDRTTTRRGKTRQLLKDTDGLGFVLIRIQ